MFWEVCASIKFYFYRSFLEPKASSLKSSLALQRKNFEQMSYCLSCYRKDTEPDMGDTVFFKGDNWCPHCSRVKEDANSNRYVLLPSPGRMANVNRDDPLDAWKDCYDMKPKVRIFIKKAKSEVHLGCLPSTIVNWGRAKLTV